MGDKEEEEWWVRKRRRGGKEEEWGIRKSSEGYHKMRKGISAMWWAHEIQCYPEVSLYIVSKNAP